MSFKSLSVLVGFQLLFSIYYVVHSQELFNITLESLENYTFPDYSGQGGSFITGGLPAIADEFPFMAALGWINESGNLEFDAGGMLISPKLVLTAAHCVYKDGKLPDAVFIGGNPFSEVLSVYLPKFSVVNVTIFPQYSPRQAYHDIAILELNASSVNTPICLWNDHNLISENVTAIGYGLTQFAGTSSQHLLKVNLTVFPAEICEPFFKRQRKFKAGISNAHICAGDVDGVKDTCQGDSGGPLISWHNERMFAVGITSTGQACSGFPPAIYTKIYSYIEWITKVLSEKGQSSENCDG